MKLRRIKIDGFKALDELDIKVSHDLLFLIGVNGAGKSSILQALSFARSFANSKVDEYFAERGWEQWDTRPRITIRSAKSLAKQNQLRTIAAKNLQMTFHLSTESAEIVWEFTWGYNVNSNLHEAIWIKHNEDAEVRRVISYTRPARTPSVDITSSIKLDDLRLPGSVLSIFQGKGLPDQRDADALGALKHWADGIISLELLSPAAMRKGIRGRPKDIGPRGERLASFIAALSPAKRTDLVARASKFYPLLDLEAIRKTAGWIDMRIQERYSNIAKISPIHMSDGFMRILALCAIPEFDENLSMVLLDEVEDGIEPHILPELIKFISIASKCQFIMTSHSPYLVNFFELEQVCFMARRDDGQTVLAKASEMDIFKEGAEYFGVGEIWANASLKTVSDAVKEASRGVTTVAYPVTDVERITAFVVGQ